MESLDFVKLLEEYYEKFGDIFPTSAFKLATREEMAVMIADCLATGEKIKTKKNVLF